MPSTATRFEPKCLLPGGCNIAHCQAPDCAEPPPPAKEVAEEVEITDAMFDVGAPHQMVDPGNSDSANAT